MMSVKTVKRILGYQPTPRTAVLVAVAVGAVAIGQPVYADPVATVAKKTQRLITGKQIKKSTITGKHIKDGSLRAKDFNRKDLKKLSAQGSRGLAGSQGATGTRGAEGPQGLQGEPGLADVSYESSAVTTDNAKKGAIVGCPEGKNVISGGYMLSGLDGHYLDQSDIEDITVELNAPQGNGFWMVVTKAATGQGDVGGNYKLTGYAVCARVSD